MRRRAPLFFLGIVLVACRGGGGQPQVVVQYVNPTPTTAITPGAPTPTPEAPELVLSAEQVYQAGAVLVSLVGPVQSGTVTFLGRSASLTRGSRSVYSFVGVGIEDQPGPHQLKVDFLLSNGTKGSLTATITVLETEWTVDTVEFTADQQQLLDPRVVANENAVLQGVYATVSPAKLWDGPWQVPIAAGVTARFGEQRAVNGAEPSGHHGGTDLGAPVGTPVYAANSGKVVMARQLQLHGNMIIIDHGGGLLSGYAHLSTFAVGEGEAVKGGDLIGYAGNTGLSTGAHLHWEIWANGVPVDAMRFTDGTDGF